MEMNVCGNCGGSFLPAEAKRLALGDFYVFFCPLCGAGRTELIPAQLSNRSEVNEQFYNLHDRISTYFGRRTEFFRRYGQSLALARKHDNIDSCLDVGCNIGYWLHFLKMAGFSRIAGVEINSACARFGCEVLGLDIVDNIDDLSGSFDLISLFDVLEHLDNPNAFLVSTLRFAHPGTLYFIQLPNYESWMARHLGNAWPWWHVPDHVWHFTPYSVTRLLTRAGFKVVELKTCDTVYDLVEYVLPEFTRTVLRLLTHVSRTSGYIYRRSGRGGLIQVLVRPGREKV
jgi:SAM-dependent methyltransferase